MKKTSITIGIPAYNEEQNIQNLIESIFKQDLKNVSLERILVNSDASTDKTNKIVTNLAQKYREVQLLKNKNRKGKYFRVNELFQKNKSDIIIILDADIALVGDKLIENLTNALLADKKAVMMVAHNVLIRPQGFVAKVLHTHFMLWDFIRLNEKNLDTPDNFYGSATAYDGNFARSLHIPDNLLDPHFYIYLSARKIHGFRYNRKTEVLQYAPATINDLKKLLKRTIGKRDKKLEKIFGKEAVIKSHGPSTSAKFIGTLRCFLWQPFYTPLAVLLGIYIGKFMHCEETNKSPIWDINTSTKKAIPYAK